MTRDAGSFAGWLAHMQAVLRGEAEADVPCDGCVGCCVSSYPIPLRPSDRAALAAVPDAYLQWPGPGGVARMDFREDGSCPMLVDAKCTIYADRPRTCRDYDCRIYAAAGLQPDGDRPVIQNRVREWRFAFDSDEERARAAAVQRAAQFIRARAHLFPGSVRAHSATAAAVLAVKAHAVFESRGTVPAGDGDEAPDVARVREILMAARAFDSVASKTMSREG